MAISELYYNNGSSVNWTNPTNAWDGNLTTYANRGIPINTDDVNNYVLSSTLATELPTGSGINITKVEVGFKVGVGGGGGTLNHRFTPLFDGSTEGDTYTQTNITFTTTYYIDITADAQAPTTWTSADVNNLDVKSWGQNTATGMFMGITSNLYEVWLRITYTLYDIYFTDGSSVDWTNPTRAWDANLTTYASRWIGANETTKYLLATTPDNTIPSGYGPTGVYAQVKVTGENDNIKIQPIFNGTAGSIYTQATTGTATTYSINITADAQAPESWTTAALNSLSVKAYGDGSGSMNVYEIYLGVVYDVVPPQNYEDSITDTITISDTIIPIRSFSGSLSDSINISVSVMDSMLYMFSLLDTINITDAISILLNNICSAGENVSINDTTTPAMSTALTVSGTIDITDTNVIASIIAGILSDTTNITDTNTILASGVVSTSEGISINDVSIPALSTTLSVSDSVGITDSVINSLLYFYTLLDQINITDTTAPLLTAITSITDTINISDTILPALIANLTTTDNVGITDTAAVAVSISVLSTDQVLIADIITAAASVEFSLADEVSITDSMVGILNAVGVVSDGVGISDSSSAVVSMVVSVSDTIDIDDIVSAASQIAVSLTDGVNITSASVARMVYGALLTFTTRNITYYFRVVDEDYYFTSRPISYNFVADGQAYYFVSRPIPHTFTST